MTLQGTLFDTSPTSTWVHQNFTTLKNKLNEVIDHVNAINTLLSQVSGGIGLTQ